MITEVRVVRSGNLEINLRDRQVLKNPQPIKLTPLLKDLLYFFAFYPNRELTHQQIISAVWRNDDRATSHTLSLSMRRLRIAIEDNPKQPRFFLSARGRYYKFVTLDPE